MQKDGECDVSSIFCWIVNASVSVCPLSPRFRVSGDAPGRAS